MIKLIEKELIIQDTQVKAYLPTNGSGGIDLYAGEHIVAHIQGKVSGIVLVNKDTRFGILIELPNNHSFNCIYADRIIRGER